MSESILRIPTPESCEVCDLCCVDAEILYCPKLNDYVNEYTDNRHPDCPLEVQEELWWLYITGKEAEDIGFPFIFKCPRCGSYSGGIFKCCSDCGTKLLPPKEKV